MRQLTDIKGLGPSTKSRLNEASIFTIEDLLMYFPKNYQEQYIQSIQKAKIGDNITILVDVLDKPSVFFFRKNLSKLSFQAQSDPYQFRVDIFNRHFLSQQIRPHSKWVITGRFKQSFKSFTASDMLQKKNYQEGIIPQYKISHVYDSRIRKIIHQVLQEQYHLEEMIPEFLLNKHHILGINDVIKYVHQPENKHQLSQAIKRLKYEEMLMFALRIVLIKEQQKKNQYSKKKYDISQVKNLIETIQFELTPSQKQATNEIFLDLKSTYQMNRLLQGDVGSGKTIVAVLSAYAAITSGYQVAIMAPTLVLAYQHDKVFRSYLEPFNVNICLLTSETTNKDKKRILQDIQNHDIDMIIGTHALIQENIRFANLGLAVIDEQHRFGVEQRKKLREKGYHPDILLMSATPIPRSLAISVFESADVSQITEKPMGRKPIQTKILSMDHMTLVYQRIEEELKHHRQVYVICPLIEENQASNLYSVEETYDMFKKVFPSYGIETLHGRLSDQEKTDILYRFKNRHTQILVSTTVIEVGIHVDQATTMVIMNANTFGLAQLHQLRGRIGRHHLQSYCYLLVDESVEDRERLNILEQTDDGFKISAYDLKLRGPGEVFGKHQSGIPNFNFANIVDDEPLLNLTIKDAQIICTSKDQDSIKLKNKILESLDSYHLD